MYGDDLLRAGIASAKAGNLAEAAMYFAQLVQEEPASEQGWLGLGSCSTDPQKREFCFRRVLALNPNHGLARQQLEKMGIQFDAPAPPATRSVPGLGVPTATSDPASASSPFLPEDGSASYGSGPSPFASEPGSFSSEPDPYGAGQYDNYELPDLPPLPVQAPYVDPAGQGGLGAARAPARRRTSAGVMAFFWSMLALFIIAVIFGAYLFLSGGMALFLPVVSDLPTQMATVAVPPTASPTPRTPTPTVPTPTITPSPIPTLRPTTTYTAILEESPCWFLKPAGVNVDCGYVLVPQDRTDPESPTIKLAFAVYHSTSANPRPEPVMFLQGGPGGEAVMLSADAYSLLVKPFITKYDFIAYDQRGTGLSEPALGCDELTGVFLQDIHGELPATSQQMIYDNAFRSCHGAMTVTQIDLNQYNTWASGTDVRDVLLTLGYQQVNLYGASYGTRLAQVVMRDHPEIVHTAILDSVVPIQAKLYNDDGANIGSSLQALFDTCAADTSCNSAYPDLQTAFWATVDTLDKNPLIITTRDSFATDITQTVDGSDLVWLTLSVLKQSDLIEYAPELIYDIGKGNYEIFEYIQSGLPFAFEGIDLGLYISVMCHEAVMVTTPADLQAAMDSFHDAGLYHLPFLGSAQDVFNTCRVWRASVPYAGENDPVFSAIPSVIIEGKFDPATPPRYGQMVAANLSNSTYVEFPNMGHVPTATDPSGCAMKIVLTFLDHPETGPDLACLSKVPPVEFLLP